MTPEGIKTMCKAIALMMFAAGACGSLAIVPYATLWDLKWVAIAGIYFVAGAVMMTGGLFSYVYLNAKK